MLITEPTTGDVPWRRESPEAVVWSCVRPSSVSLLVSIDRSRSDAPGCLAWLLWPAVLDCGVCAALGVVSVVPEVLRVCVPRLALCVPLAVAPRVFTLSVDGRRDV